MRCWLLLNGDWTRLEWHMADSTWTNRLARRRVTLGFLAALAVLWLAAPTRASLVAGGSVAVVGEWLRLWAAGHLNKSREVTSTGPYRWLAHPLYVGSSVMGLGVAIASGRVIVVVLVALYLATTITAAIRQEEAFLRSRFGDRYDRYRRGVGGDSDDDGRKRYSVSQAMANREYRAAAGLVVAVLLLYLKARYSQTF
jgi:protein-S-isoprenylcysteine O-methyltransferase Ste14